MKLDSYIKEFLIQNDNVIVKGFGAFEKVLESAVIDEKSGEIHPPHMTIKFDNSLKIDSGTLSKFIAKKEKISEEDAVKKIVDIVKLWNDDLKAGKLVTLEGIGIISEDKTGKRKFEAKIQTGVFPDMYGLPLLSIDETNKAQQRIQQDVKKKVQENKKPDVKEKVKEETKKTPTQTKSTLQQKKPIKKVNKPIRKPQSTNEDDKTTKKIILSALIVIPIIILIVFGALNFDYVKGTFNNSSEYVSNLLSGNSEETQINSDLDSNQVSDTNELDSAQNQTEVVLENYTIINAETNESVPAKTEDLIEFSNVEVIAGSFKSKRNAKKFSNQLSNKGFTCKVLARTKGLYRVSVGSFNDVNQAAVEIVNIQELDPNLNVWILLNK